MPSVPTMPTSRRARKPATQLARVYHLNNAFTRGQHGQRMLRQLAAKHRRSATDRTCDPLVADCALHQMVLASRFFTPADFAEAERHRDTIWTRCRASRAEFYAEGPIANVIDFAAERAKRRAS